MLGINNKTYKSSLVTNQKQKIRKTVFHIPKLSKKRNYNAGEFEKLVTKFDILEAAMLHQMQNEILKKLIKPKMLLSLEIVKFKLYF
jgi:hypothetical protein